jgi:hypothetical protein
VGLSTGGEQLRRRTPARAIKLKQRKLRAKNEKEGSIVIPPAERDMAGRIAIEEAARQNPRLLNCQVRCPQPGVSCKQKVAVLGSISPPLYVKPEANSIASLVVLGELYLRSLHGTRSRQMFRGCS